MTRTTPRVEGGSLYLLSQDYTSSATIPLGSEQWYTWLESHCTFRVKNDGVTYTARKERRAGLWYWYAYRKCGGKLRIVYLGKTEELSLERLNSVAQVFALPSPLSRTRRNGSRISPIFLEAGDRASPDGTSSTFPSARSNLPTQLTSFVGRKREILEATQLLTYGRLLTLTGVGGIGKTRLALQIASSLSGRFPGGLWFVDLARINAPTELLTVLTLALGIRPKTEEDLFASIQVALSEAALVIFDNCEHLLAACAPIVERLLSNNPVLSVLATSREMLCIPGEIVLAVPPFPLPEPGECLTALQASQAEAVQFLLERIKLLQPSFVLTEENVLTVVRVCQQLEGIPLALELAAGRLHLMPLEEIAQRLDEKPGARFHLLTNGKRATAERHQTLRATVDWSYQLLSQREQKLLRRLSVFMGGWTLEAAETICAGEGVAQAEMLDLLGKLIHKSLVLVSEEVFPASINEASRMYKQARYRLLETIREYGREKLQTAGEEQGLQVRHLAFFLQLAQKADTHLRGPEQLYWLACLDREHGNLQVALHTARQADSGGALRLASSLAFYWIIRAQFIQGRKELEETLSIVGDDIGALKADCLARASLLAFFQGDMKRSRHLAETSLAMFQGAEYQQ
ncbi:MAG: hypothetical protein JO011_19435, partial [Ktedonobacteraceae bacterium]|nr:hypothetical protein [Ktedonobacteraceae bacterium]